AVNLGLKKNFFGTNLNMDKIITLIQAVDKIYSNNDPFNYQQIYSKCHEICQNRHGKDLYETLEIYFNYKIREIQSKLITLKQNETKQTFLKHLVDFYRF